MDPKTRRETLKWIRKVKREMDNQIHALFLLKESIRELEKMFNE